jgi:peroxiredoxin
MIPYSLLMSMVALAALAVGAAAPEFEAVAQDGRKVSLAELRKEGPVVLVFLRGFS